MKILIIEDFMELTSLMPLILEGYTEMNKRCKVFNMTAEEYTKELIRLVAGPSHEGVAVCYHDDGTPVGYAAIRDNTEVFATNKQMLFFAVYVQPKFSKQYRKPLFDFGEQVAVAHGYSEVIAYNSRFSGACFRLFEQVFGMRRQMIRFSKKITK